MPIRLGNPTLADLENAIRVTLETADRAVVRYEDMELFFSSQNPHPDSFNHFIFDYEAIKAWAREKGWHSDFLPGTESEMLRPVFFTRYA